MKLQFHAHTFLVATHLHIMLSYLFRFVQIGDDEGEEEPSDHRKKHKKSSHHHPHSHRYLLLIFRSASFSGNCSDLHNGILVIFLKKICREHFNDRYRVGSDLSSKLATRQVTLWVQRSGGGGDDIGMRMTGWRGYGLIMNVGDNWRGACSDRTWSWGHRCPQVGRE